MKKQQPQHSGLYTQAAHQKFVARIERFRKRDRPFPGEHDNVILDRLCVNDSRMQRFWTLIDGLSDDKFNSLIEDLLGEASPNVLREEDVNAAALDKTKKAIIMLGKLNKTLAFLRHPSAHLILRNKVLNQLPAQSECLHTVQRYLQGIHEHLRHNASGYVVSRKAKNHPHVEFAASAVYLMETYLGRPHHAVVANLAGMLYDVEISPDAVRKASDRHTKALDLA